MASNLMSLPLEIRYQIYGYVLSDDHDIFAHGVPAFLKVRLELTQEIYSYRRLTSTIPITDNNFFLTEPEFNINQTKRSERSRDSKTTHAKRRCL